MMDILDAFFAHAQLQVPGLKICDIDDLPGKDEAAAIVAKVGAVMFPIFNEVSGGFSVPTSTPGHGDETITIQFLCLVRRAQEDYAPKTIIPVVIQVYQDYRQALIGNPDLALEGVHDGLAKDITLSVLFSVFEWPAGTGEFWLGFQVTHTWEFLFDDI